MSVEILHRSCGRERKDSCGSMRVMDVVYLFGSCAWSSLSHCEDYIYRLHEYIHRKMGGCPLTSSSAAFSSYVRRMLKGLGMKMCSRPHVSRRAIIDNPVIRDWLTRRIGKCTKCKAGLRSGVLVGRCSRLGTGRRPGLRGRDGDLRVSSICLSPACEIVLACL